MLVRHSNDRTRSVRPGRRAVAVVLASTVVVGGSVAAGVAQATTTNLVANRDFEDGLAGWYTSAPFTVERVSPGHDGDWAALVTNSGSTTRTGALNDTVNTVAKTVAGHRYRARAYVKADVAGRRLAVRLMEYRAGTLLGEQTRTVVAGDTGWHRVAVDYTAAADGATLDLNVLGRALPAGASFFVDDVKLVDRGPAPDAAAAPVPVPASPSASPDPGPTATATQAPTATASPSPTVGDGSATAPAPTKSTDPAPTPTPTKPAPVPAGWNLVWSDEFDGAVDPADWTVENRSTYGDGNSELACLMNRPENISASAGVLTLRARREATPIACGSSDARFPGGRSYTSAMLKTKNAWTYGRFEIRAKLPLAPGASKGLWPAFWLRPVGGGTGELDVLEAIGSGAGADTSNKIHQTIWYDYNGTHPKQVSVATTPFDVSAGWHTYATEWERGEIRWYIDGKLTYSRTSTTTSWLDDAFAKPFYVRLNLAVGGTWPGSPDASTAFPAAYSIDYLRVYQR
ncbi:family 16 glycosylhydrolase [Kineosporia sp. A_224]|uniref:family 16 glycosylhydrolase n=1 Tax=Kineosporia sp. A_224 TaxID=1962180 RepID=UPI00117AE88A|nr:family 16 glycosylhydrolase [Kineosporia sp. A_224]